MKAIVDYTKKEKSEFTFPCIMQTIEKCTDKIRPVRVALFVNVGFAYNLILNKTSKLGNDGELFDAIQNVIPCDDKEVWEPFVGTVSIVCD